MYKLGAERKLGKTASHRKAMIRNQVRSLFINGKVETTTPKAKVLKANAESFLSDGAVKEDRAKEMLLSMSLKNEDISRVLEYLKTEPKVSLVRVGYRDGDNAELSKVRLVGFSKEDKKKASKPKKKEEKEEKPAETKGDEPKDPKAPKDQKDQAGVKKSIRSRLNRKQTRARSRSGI